ncbi:MAG: DoxX family protein [Myxococcota bacterium]
MRPAYWATTAVVALLFLVPGVLNLAGAPHIVHDMAHLGYPAYFPRILGAWKVLAATAVLAPGTRRLKEWAYAGMIFDLTGAAASRVAVGDPAPLVLVPLAIAAVVILSWALRPEDRALLGLSRSHA